MYICIYIYICIYVCKYVCMYVCMEISDHADHKLRLGHKHNLTLDSDWAFAVSSLFAAFRLRSVFKMSCLFLRPRLWRFEIRYSTDTQATCLLLGFETLNLKFCDLKLWKPTVSDHADHNNHAGSRNFPQRSRRGPVHQALHGLPHYIYIYIYICMYVYVYIYIYIDIYVFVDSSYHCIILRVVITSYCMQLPAEVARNGMGLGDIMGSMPKMMETSSV